MDLVTEQFFYELPSIVNDVLAKHYGIPGVSGPEWRRVEKVAAHGRGGFTGFGAVLAKQSAARRPQEVVLVLVLRLIS